MTAFLTSSRGTSSRGVGILIGILPTLILATACGGSTGEPTGTAETTVETWSDYCVATFTEEHQVLDFFDDPMFTAAIGDQFVIAVLGADESELVLIADDGPETFTIQAEGGGMPFSTSCVVGSTTNHIAVFASVTVFAEEELTTPLCELAAGTAVAYDPTMSSGYGTTGTGVNTSITYEVMLNALGAECGGASLGYISVPQTNSFGTTTWLVPIISIAGPS